MPHDLKDDIFTLRDRRNDVVVRRLTFMGQIGVEVGGQSGEECADDAMLATVES
jgi:hypothetical protein